MLAVEALKHCYSGGGAFPPLRLERLNAAIHEQLRKAAKVSGGRRSSYPLVLRVPNTKDHLTPIPFPPFITRLFHSQHDVVLLSGIVFGLRLHALCGKKPSPCVEECLAMSLQRPADSQPDVIPITALLEAIPLPASGHTLELSRLCFATLGGCVTSLLALGRLKDAERLVLERCAAWLATVARLLSAAPAAHWVASVSTPAPTQQQQQQPPASPPAPLPNALVATLAGVRAFQQQMFDALVKAASEAPSHSSRNSNSPSREATSDQRGAEESPLALQLRLRTTAFIFMCKTAACRAEFAGDSSPSSSPTPAYGASPSALLLHVLGASRWAVDDYFKQAQAQGQANKQAKGLAAAAEGSRYMWPPVLESCKRLYVAIREAFPQQQVQQGSSAAAAISGSLTSVWSLVPVHEAFLKWLHRYAKLCRASGDHRSAADVIGSALAYLQRRYDGLQQVSTDNAEPAASSGGSSTSVSSSSLCASIIDMRCQAAGDSLQAALLSQQQEGRAVVDSSLVVDSCDQAGRHLQAAISLLGKHSAAMEPSAADASLTRITSALEQSLATWQQSPLAAAALQQLQSSPATAAVVPTAGASSSSPSATRPIDWLVHLEQTALAACKTTSISPNAAAAGASGNVSSGSSAGQHLAAARSYGVACGARLLRLHTAPVVARLIAPPGGSGSSKSNASSSSSSSAAAAGGSVAALSRQALIRLAAAGLVDAESQEASSLPPLMDDESIRRLKEAVAHVNRGVTHAVAALPVSSAHGTSADDGSVTVISGLIAPLYALAIYYYSSATSGLLPVSEQVSDSSGNSNSSKTASSSAGPSAAHVIDLGVAIYLLSAICRCWEEAISAVSAADVANRMPADLLSSVINASRLHQRYQLLGACDRLRLEASVGSQCPSSVDSGDDVILGTMSRLITWSIVEAARSGDVSPSLCSIGPNACVGSSCVCVSAILLPASDADSSSADTLSYNLTSSLRKAGAGAIIGHLLKQQRQPSDAGSIVDAISSAFFDACTLLSTLSAPLQPTASPCRTLLAWSLWRALADTGHRVVEQQSAAGGEHGIAPSLSAWSQLLTLLAIRLSSVGSGEGGGGPLLLCTAGVHLEAWTADLTREGTHPYQQQHTPTKQSPPPQSRATNDPATVHTWACAPFRLLVQGLEAMTMNSAPASAVTLCALHLHTFLAFVAVQSRGDSAACCINSITDVPSLLRSAVSLVTSDGLEPFAHKQLVPLVLTAAAACEVIGLTEPSHQLRHLGMTPLTGSSSNSDPVVPLLLRFSQLAAEGATSTHDTLQAVQQLEQLPKRALSPLAAETAAAMAHDTLAAGYLRDYATACHTASLEQAQEHASLAVKGWARLGSALRLIACYESGATSSDGADGSRNAKASAQGLFQAAVLLMNAPALPCSNGMRPSAYWPILRWAICARLTSSLLASSHMWAMRGDLPKALYTCSRAAGTVKAAVGGLTSSSGNDLTPYQRLQGQCSLLAALAGSKADAIDHLSEVVAAAGGAPGLSAAMQQLSSASGAVTPAVYHALATAGQVLLDLQLTELHLATGLIVTSEGVSKALRAVVSSDRPVGVEHGFSSSLLAFCCLSLCRLAAQGGDFAAAATAAREGCQSLQDPEKQGSGKSSISDTYHLRASLHYWYGACLLRFQQADKAKEELLTALRLMTLQPDTYFRPHEARLLCRVLALALHQHQQQRVPTASSVSSFVSGGPHALLVLTSILPSARYRCLASLSKQQAQGGAAMTGALGSATISPSHAGSSDGHGDDGQQDPEESYATSSSSSATTGPLSPMIAYLRACEKGSTTASSHSVLGEAALLDPLLELQQVQQLIESQQQSASAALPSLPTAQAFNWPPAASPIVALAVELVTRTLLVVRWTPPSASPATIVGGSSANLSLTSGATVMASIPLRRGDQDAAAHDASGASAQQQLGAISGDVLTDVTAEFDAILRASGASLAADASPAALAAGLSSSSSSSSGVTSQEPDDEEGGGGSSSKSAAGSSSGSSRGRSASAAGPLSSLIIISSSSKGGKIAAVAAAAASSSSSSSSRQRSKSTAAASTSTGTSSSSSSASCRSGSGWMSSSEKAAWWAGRHALDDRLRRLCEGMQAQLLGHAASLLIPPQQAVGTAASVDSDGGLAQSLASLAIGGGDAATPASDAAALSAPATASDVTAPSSAAPVIEATQALLQQLDGLKVPDLKRELAARGLSQTGKKGELTDRLREALMAEGQTGAASCDHPAVASASPPSTASPAHTTATAPNTGCVVLLLLLCESLHHLPWESMPCLRAREGEAAALVPVTRLPTHALALLHWQRTKAMTSPSSSRLVTGVPSCRPRADDDDVTAAAGAPSGYTYVINPSGDLSRTQRTLQPVMDAVASLAASHVKPAGMPVRGLAGAPAPSPEQLLRLLSQSDLYLYCGHGAGEPYLPRDALTSSASTSSLGLAPSCTPAPPSLLMGCSSGRLVRRGQASDPDGFALALLLAGGAPCVVGALWDVTDKDIDRYTTALVGSWLLPPGALTEATSTSSSGSANSSSSSSASQASDDPPPPPQPLLPLAVACARSVCRLPFLVGGAPVVYGLPLLATP